MKIIESGLFIKVENGQAVDHPAVPDNLIMAFGEIPSNWEPFIRVECTLKPNTFEYIQTTYEKIDGIWQNVNVIADMNDEQKVIRTQAIFEESNIVIQMLKDSTINLMNQTKNSNNIISLQNYMNSLNTWSFVDPENLNYPKFPILEK